MRQLLSSLILAILLPVSVYAEEQMPDVRLLIDVSGSMRQSDPANLRGPALDLMLRLLPEGSKAGVWTFGERVNMQVAHGEVNSQWREDAASAVAGINNHGLYTNIPDALELATYDAHRLGYRYRTSVILLTDGKVDIAGNPLDNARAASDVLEKHAIDLRDQGVQVHTIALSDDADWEFLKRLAHSTGGLAEKAESAEALSAVFLQALDIAAPTEQVPLLGGEFLIDESVSEFTVLVFAEDDLGELLLQSPSGDRFDKSSSNGTTAWFLGSGFGLITVAEPAAGLWRVNAPGAIARVNVLSALSLRVEGLDSSIPSGRIPEIGISLDDGGSRVRDESLLGVVSVDVTVVRNDTDRWQLAVAEGEMPNNGEARLSLPMLAEPGRYELIASLDGGSFQRQIKLVSDVYAPEPEPVLDLPEPPPKPDRGWLLPGLLSGVLAIVLLVWWLRERTRSGRDFDDDPVNQGDPDEDLFEEGFDEEEGLITGINSPREDQTQ